MKSKLFSAFALLALCCGLSGCGKVYLNWNKSENTNVLVGSDEYLNRILNAVYESSELKSGSLVMSMKNETLDNEHFWYYVYANNDILRIAEDYSFIYYKNCEWWNLSYNMPIIENYESAVQYNVLPESSWYFISYHLDGGVEVVEEEEEERVVEELQRLGVDWVQRVRPEDVEGVLVLRLLHAHLLQRLDDRLLAGEEPLGVREVEDLLLGYLELGDEPALQKDLDALLFALYVDEGAHAREYAEAVLGPGVLERAVEEVQAVEDHQRVLEEYLEHVGVVDGLLAVQGVEDASALRVPLLDELLGLPQLGQSLDVHGVSLHNQQDEVGDLVQQQEGVQEHVEEE